MPKSLQANSLLIVAVSGRALAQAARRAGYIPLVADFFTDADTEALAHACRKVPGSMRRGFAWLTLESALEELAAAAPSPLLGIIYGAGFEDRPELLTGLASRWPLLGNDAAIVARLKAPETFFGTLAALGVAHPRTLRTRPSGTGWLRKSEGGAGGSHISQGRRRRHDAYYQEIIVGRAVSALFVGDGDRAQVLGFSAQWTAPKRGAPYRYGGAVRPASLDPAVETAMTSAVERAAGAFSIKGLASADFIVSAEGASLLEINPRLGATLDVFDSDEAPLLALHMDAILKQELKKPAQAAGAAAAAIVYAPEGLTIRREMSWPDWVADRPRAGERIDKERPICTVAARASSAEDAKRLVEARTATILAELSGRSGGKGYGQKSGNQRAPRRLAERQHHRRPGRSGADR